MRYGAHRKLLFLVFGVYLACSLSLALSLSLLLSLLISLSLLCGFVSLSVFALSAFRQRQPKTIGKNKYCHLRLLGNKFQSQFLPLIKRMLQQLFLIPSPFPLLVTLIPSSSSLSVTQASTTG
jgi:hypothetical protein